MLSPIQKEIVELPGNLIVRASAGTGKTHTMVSKIEYDIAHCHTHKAVAAITFTIKAAAEIKDRLTIDREKGFSIPSTHGIGRSFSYRCTRKALVDAILIMLLCKSVYFTEYRKPKYPVTAKM